MAKRYARRELMRTIRDLSAGALTLPLIGFGPSYASGFQYPPSRQGGVVDNYFGISIPDPYRWLEEVQSAEVKRWVEAQNEITERHIARFEARDVYRTELQAIVQSGQSSAPWKVAERWFQLRRREGQDQYDLYWGDSADAISRLLLDVNAMSETAGRNLMYGGSAVSPDGRYLAYLLRPGGSDWMIGRIREIATGEDMGVEFTQLRLASLVWHPDSSGVYYVRQATESSVDNTFVSYRQSGVWFHRLGTSVSNDLRLRGIADNDVRVYPFPSEDGKLLVFHGADLHSFRTQYIYFKPLDDDSSEYRRIVNPDKSSISYVGVRGGHIYFATFYNAPYGRIVKTPLDNPGVEHWIDVVAEQNLPMVIFGKPARLLENHIVTLHEDIAFNRLRLHTLDGSGHTEVDTLLNGRMNAGPGYDDIVAFTSGKNEILFSMSSVFVEETVISYNIDTGKSRFLIDPRSPLDHKEYSSQVIWGDSTAGAKVPVSIFYRNDVTPNGRRATLFYAYGHAGINPANRPFRAEWAVWLKTGGVLAICHARGGPEFGKNWHIGGTGRFQQRTIDDCIACVETVQRAGWSSPSHSAFNGGSGGGLTTAAVMTQRPDLFSACIPERGVYDLLRYHILAKAATEEVGTSETQEGFNTIYAYSPLHRIDKDADYPAVFVTIGEFDNRVHPASSYKFVAELQATLSARQRPVLLRVDIDAGHNLARSTAIVANRADFLTFLKQALEHKIEFPLRGSKQ